MLRLPSLFALSLLASCSSETSEDNSAFAGAPQPATGEATMVGLYEGGVTQPRNQLCLAPGEDGATRFGLVVWGSANHSCSGSGAATREGGRLRLAMAGDEACILDAQIAGPTLTLPAALPEGCAYYCGANASMAEAQLTQVGTTRADAAKATDLVGEPLCTG